jgi:peptidoglycan/xylan/chitin deacetylase (PgdA/CDA1 family)
MSSDLSWWPRATAVGAVVLAIGCSGGAQSATDDAAGASDVAASDGASEAASSVDAGADVTSETSVTSGDAGADASDASDATTLPPCVFDANDDVFADAERLGLPTVDVPVSAPIVTPQTSVSPPSDNYRKAIGVLSLSPHVTDLQAVEHVLRPMGLPYQITTSPKLSVQHDMALFFPEANPGNFTADELTTIGNYLLEGGVIVQKVGNVPETNKMGGVTGGVLRQAHQKLTLTAAGKAEFPSLDEPNEQEILLSGSTTEFLDTWDLQLDPAATSAVVLAEFEDGTAAIVKNPQPPGVVYTFGVDYRDVVLRAQLGHNLYNARAYINDFDPGVDVWLLMVRDIYDAHVPFAVRLNTAPSDARAVALFTHDLDWGTSYDNAVEYAAQESMRGIKGTYFLHTKVVTDYQDVAFFDQTRAPFVEQLLAMGHAVGSHTVAHSVVLDSFPVGDGTEVYPGYAPFNVSKTVTTGGTLFGELRVSKSLIDAMTQACGQPHDTISFRAGELSYNMAAPQTMERLGYRYDATRAIGDVISSFPYRQMTDWDAGGLDTSVYEFALSIEDELPPKLDTRAMDAVTIMAANADNGAPTVVLIHPNVTDYKLAAQEIMMDHLPSGMVGLSLDQYGEFWRARDGVTISSVDYDEAAMTMTVKLQSTEAAEGIAFHVSSWVKTVVSPSGAALHPWADGGGMVTLPPFAPGESKTIVMTYSH